MQKILAHGGHNHLVGIDANSFWLEDFLANEWYIVLPAYIGLLVVVGLAVYFIFKKSITAVYFAWLGIFLVVGLLGYNYSPLLSIVSLSGGFFLAFATIFGGALTGKK